MQSTAFITGADRGLGLALCQGLLQRGWHVLAGQYMPNWSELAALTEQFPAALQIIPLDVSSDKAVQAAARLAAAHTGHLDLLVNNAGVTSPTTRRGIRETLDYAEMHRMIDINTLGPLRVVEAFLPLMDQGAGKRLVFVSSEAGSITASQRTAWFGYCMSKTALNMGVKILFNDLRTAGYTFRLYHPGWMRSYMGGKKNNEATLELDEAAEAALPIFLDSRPDEDRLVLVDYQGNEWPW